MSQLTVPEKKSYVWERLSFIHYGKARQLVRNFKTLQPELFDALDEVQLMGKTLTGERLKALVIHVAREKNWCSTRRTTPFRARDASTDAQLKACSICATLKPLSSYRMPITKKQALHWKQLPPEEVPGFTDMYGVYHRGHTAIRDHTYRTYINNVCAECRVVDQPKSRHPYHSPGRNALIQHIKSVRTQTNKTMYNARKLKITPQQRLAREAFYKYKLLLLGKARYEIEQARKRKARGPVPAVEWQLLLTPEQRAELERLYSLVYWQRRKGEIWG